MSNYAVLIKQLTEDLQQETDSLKAWESFERVTLSDHKGKVINLRSEMITRHKLNMQKYREMIAALQAKQDR